MIDMNVFELVSEVPKGKKAISTRFVFKLKLLPDGSIDKYKARLVARGFSQIPGQDFDQTYSPASNLLTVRLVLSLACIFHCKLYQVDIKGAFLQSPLKEDLYIQLPEGFSAFGGYRYAKLKKSLYGLKQAAHDWYQRQDYFMLKIFGKKYTTMQRSSMDTTLYISNDVKTGELFIAVVHIDDYCVATNSETMFKDWLSMYSSFCTDKGDVEVLSKPAYQQMLVDYTQTPEVTEIKLHQGRQIDEALLRFGMSDCKPASTPMEYGLQLPFDTECDTSLPYRALIGVLLWIARCTRPDIYFVVIHLAQFSTCAISEHFTAAKRVLRYLKGSRHLDLCYSTTRTSTTSSGDNIKLDLFTDSDWATDKSDRKSISGYVLYVNGMLVSWSSRKQDGVSTSSTESEFISLVEGAKDVLFIVQLLQEFFVVELPINVGIDNQGAQAMAEHNLSNTRSKHIDIKYRFITDWVQKGLLSLRYVSTSDNRADIMTKALRPADHQAKLSLLHRPIESVEKARVNVSKVYKRFFNLSS